jgi:hypothetical protein
MRVSLLATQKLLDSMLSSHITVLAIAAFYMWMNSTAHPLPRVVCPQLHEAVSSTTIKHCRCDTVCSAERKAAA